MSRVKHARRAASKVALYVAEGVGLVLVGAAIAATLLFWRLSQGPISLDFMRDELEEALADALRGDVVSIGEAQASWRSRDRSVGIVLTDVTVAESGGDILAQSPRLAADLSLAALLRADVAFSRLVVEGGEASIVRIGEGQVSVGLGDPAQVGARAQSRPQGPPRGLDFLRDALTEEGVVSELRELRLEGATLFIQDAVTGIDWEAQDATLRVLRDGSGMRAEAGGAIETSGRDATLSLQMRASPTLRQAQVDLEISGATPSSLFPSEGPLAQLSRIELPVSAAASIVVDDTRGLLAAELNVSLSAGQISVLDREVDVRSARAQMSYDPSTDTLAVEDSEIQANLLSGRFSGRMIGAGAWLREGDGAGPYPVRFGADDLQIDLRPVFEHPLSASSIAIDGLLYPDEMRVTLDALDADVRGVTAEFGGEVDFERVSDGRLLPSIKLSGPIGGEASLRDVLDFWPVHLADGGRVWVSKAVHSGRAFNIRLDLDMPAEALVVERLDDERLTLSFDFADAEVAFLSTMSPVSDAVGSGVLRGNSFSIALQSAEMAGLTYESGFVDIPRLNPKGAIARFGGRMRGETSALLAFIDEPPLQFPSSYGVAPSSIGGSGVVDFEIQRAMLDQVPAEDIGYDIKGEFEGVSAPTMFPGLGLTDAAVTLTASPAGLEAVGEGRLGPAPARVEWREDFGDDVQNSTSYHVETTLDAAAFDAFGAPVRRVFTGRAGIVLDAQGRGLDIAGATVAADLTEAGLALPDGSWSKPEGEAADARLTVAMGEGGRIEISDAELTAPGAALAGAITLAGDGRLESLDLTRLQIEDLVDASGSIARDGDGGLIVRATGAYADVRSVVEQLARGGGDEADAAGETTPEGGAEDGVEDADEPGTPFSLDVRFDRATARDGAELRDLALVMENDGRRTRSMTFTASGEGGPIMAQVTPASEIGGPRLFALDAADAGEALYTFFGVNSVRGGALSARAELPPLEAPEGAPTTAVVQASDFVVAQAPVLAQILTIGSLEGLANTLGGEGIRFARLDAPLSIVDGRITLNEAQASGSALGITVNGLVDLEARDFDLEGVLVPAYSVNSVLGNVPVLGDLLVNRDGEGVFGLTYSITGPFEATRVVVNPLSALAPGFLRRLFQPVQAVTAEPEPAEPPVNAPPRPLPDDIRPPPPGGGGGPGVAISPGGSG